MSALQSPPKPAINLLALKPLPAPVDKERLELEERERRIREKDQEQQRQESDLEKRKKEVEKQGQEHEKTRTSNETLKQKVRETENELNAFKAKMMLHEVNTVRHANGTKRMIYLTNKDADNITTSERIAKMLHDFELPAYHLVINLITCSGMSVRLDGAKKLGVSGEDLLGKSGILDIAETLKAEKDLEQFMEEVVIPMAVEHRALVMCSPSSNCSITMAFTRAVKLCREKYGGQLPFTILASTYAVSVHLKTMESGFEQALKESSETWKRHSDDLEKAVYRFREVEGKQRNMPQHVLGNIGNLTVNDELTHFIFVEGMDEAADGEEERRPKMSSGPNTAWVRLLSRISEHLATSTPTIGMCTQESTATSKTQMAALLKNKVPVLLIDLRRRGRMKPIASGDDSNLRVSLDKAIEDWAKNAKELREKGGQRCETWDICTLSHMNSFLKVKKQGGDLLKIARSMRGHSATDAAKKKERGKKTVGSGTSAQDVYPGEEDIRKVIDAIAIDAASGKPAQANVKDELEHLLKDGNLWSCHVDDLEKSKKLFDSLVMSEMVEPVRDKTMVFLSNWQTRKLNEDIEEIGGIKRQKGIERLLFALGIEEPKMVINLINCRGLDHIATAGETTKLHQSPVRDKTLVEAQEDELEYFMKKVVIPVAAQKRALVICDTSTTCSMSMAFTLAVGQLMQAKSWLKDDVDKNRGKLPFSILGTTYGNSVHKTASDPRGQDFVSEVFKASRVWKKSEKLLSEAIENFKSEGKLPQFILDNLGRLSVSDQLSRYIFVDGMEMKLNGNGKMVPTLQTGPDTPWVHMINKIITHYVSLYDSICLCTQEPGGTSNARLKTFLDVSEGCAAKSGNKAILLIDLRKRDENMLGKRDANQNESTSDKDREKNLLSALAQWQEENHERVFPSSKAEQDNVMYAEKWDYCTMAYFRGFLVSEKRQAGGEVVFEDKFPKTEHFEKVADVMVHQRLVEDLAFRIRKGLDDTGAKRKECEGSIDKLKADKKDDELKNAKEELEKHKQRIKDLESLQKKLKDWSGKRPKNDLGAQKFKDLADELKKAAAAKELGLWDDSKDGLGIQNLKGDISLILRSKSVSACLINAEQRQKDSYRFKQNHELFNKIIGNKAPPKALQSGMSVVQLDRSATGRSSFQTLAENSVGSVSAVDNSGRDILSEGLCRQCRERIGQEENHESQGVGQTEDALAVAALDSRKNSSSTCGIM